MLVVDDEPGMREFLSICLSRAGHEVRTAESGAEGIRVLEEHPDIDVVITDLTMPGISGMEVLRHACALPHPPSVVMITAFATAETAIEAMKVGAYDYLTKPFKVDEIQVVTRRAIERQNLSRENRRLREQLRGVGHLDKMVGKSPAMLKVFELTRRVAPTRTNVLIRGESGTGKELVARALHSLSDRADGPFVAVNCGAIPESLMESELFGHVRGAFTGANQERQGMFAAAEGGTLFLDEVGELPVATQVRLLRALQERKVRPVGSNAEIEVDCRVVAATNRDLEAAIEAGEFRQDLYFRLNVVTIHLPPLRRRPDDIPVLVQRAFERFNAEAGRQLEGIEPAAMDWLLQHAYPGNVRELENIIERAVTLESGRRLSSQHFPPLSPHREGSSPSTGLPPGGIDLDRELADLERHLIVAALDEAGGVRKKAAALLHISLRSLRYRLEKLGIELATGRDPDPGKSS